MSSTGTNDDYINPGYAYVSAVKSPTDSYLQLVHGDVDNVKVGETVSMIAKTTADLNIVTVQVKCFKNLFKT